MKKAGANAMWNRLEPGQRLELARWLFEEKIGYEKALARAKKKFGYAGSVSGLRRFYQRTWEERLLTGLAAAETMIDAVENAGAGAERMRSAGMKVVARLFLQKVLETPDDMKEWGPLAKLLLQSEDNELRRELKTEENDLRRQHLEFAQARFQFDMVASARKVLPQLQEMEDARKMATDPDAWELEENRRMNAIRIRMFGDSVPSLKPETAEEKANPELIKKKLAEMHRRADERWARERVEIAKRNAELERRYEEKQKREAAARAEREASEKKKETENEDEGQEVKKSDAGMGPTPETGTGTPEQWIDGAVEDMPEERRKRGDELMQRAFEMRKEGC